MLLTCKVALVATEVILMGLRDADLAVLTTVVLSCSLIAVQTLRAAVSKLNYKLWILYC